MQSVQKDVEIYYRLGFKGVFKKYQTPLTIDKHSTLSLYAQKNGIKSATIITDFYKIDPNIKIELKTAYANQYNAGGDNALIDGVIGTEDFRTGTWQGYFDTDVVAIVDLGAVKPIQQLQINFLKDQRSWLFLPKEVEIFTSNDGKKFKNVAKKTIPTTLTPEPSFVKNFTLPLETQNARYIKIKVKSNLVNPSWHPAPGAPCWVFIDEIMVE